jgi:hypothetical protein
MDKAQLPYGTYEFNPANLETFNLAELQIQQNHYWEYEGHIWGGGFVKIKLNTGKWAK